MAEFSYHCKFLDCTLELNPLAYNCLFIIKVNPSMLYIILVYPRKERKSHKFIDLVEGITLSIVYSGSKIKLIYNESLFARISFICTSSISVSTKFLCSAFGMLLPLSAFSASIVFSFQ